MSIKSIMHCESVHECKNPNLAWFYSRLILSTSGHCTSLLEDSLQYLHYSRIPRNASLVNISSRIPVRRRIFSRMQHIHLIIRQLKIKDIGIFLDPLGCCGFRKRNEALVQSVHILLDI